MSQICGILKNPVITRQNLPAISRPIVPPFATRSARVVEDVESERLKAGESNCKLPLCIYLERSVPEPYRSPDWALVPVKQAQGLNTTNNIVWLKIFK
jgi:hypothetical protein